MSRRGWGLMLLVELALALGLWAAWQRQPGPDAADESAPPAANGHVALLTDYGSEDPYVGILKGAILSVSPRLAVHDLTHEAPAFDVAAGAYLLGRTAREWPAGTTFVVVIDPGVGTARDMLAAVAWPSGHRFVAPDNGVLTDVLADAERVEVRRITNAALARPGAESSTFHGRDWFGPVGAFLAAGGSLAEVGPPAERVIGLTRQPAVDDGGVALGSVLFVDHYGNVLTNLTPAHLEAVGAQPGGRVRLRLGEQEVVAPWVGTYADVPQGELLVTTNSEQQIEIAVNQGHAGERLGAVAGAQVTAAAP